MTWHFRTRLGVVSIAVATLLLAACGDDDDASITITAPDKGKELTQTDDLDDAKAGLQYDVKASSSGVSAGTNVLLTIEGETDAAQTSVAKDGSILFDNVTLAPGKHTLTVSAGNVHSAADYDYTYKAVVIESPADGAALGSLDDKDTSAEGVQVNVSVMTYAVDPNEAVTLQVDGETLNNNGTKSANGRVVFSGVTLSSGAHALKAIAGAAESSTSRVSVNSGCASVTYISPEPPTEGRLTLGGSEACPSGTDPFVVDVVISTDAGDGRSVDLKVNDTMVANAKVKGSLATFEKVELGHRKSANTLSVVVNGAQGVTCEEAKYPSEIWVDCDGGDCSIKAPQLKSGVDASGASTYYLNKSGRTGDAFDIEVATDTGAVGQPVKLIIDGNDEDAPSADPEGSDSNVQAKFDGVKLSEGAHTIQARCQDGAGNIYNSPKLSWTVDTVACSIDVTQPSENTLFVPADDTDKNSGGVQVSVRSTIKGDGCVDTRAAPCNPADGIQNVGFNLYDGKSPHSEIATLTNGKAQQTLCAEVQDRAGNIGRDSVAVRYRSEEPKVKIESPVDGASFNVDGANNHTADSEPSDTKCDANFSVACSDIGAPVSLHRVDASGPVFATADCLALAQGDPPIPSGYVGRAHFTNTEFLASGSDTVKVVATQSEAGAGETALVGASDSITLKGDCNPPTLTWAVNPCTTGPIGVANANTTVTKDITAIAASADSDTATITVTNPDRGGATAEKARDGGSFSFPATLLGGPGDGTSPLTVTVSTKDAYDNTFTLTCDTEIVFDLPTLTLSAPADNTVFGTSTLCDPPGTATIGVQITGAIDSAANRTVTLSINGGADITLPASGTAVNSCVAVDEGESTLVIKAASTRTSATATETRKITMLTQSPSGGITLSSNTLPSTTSGTYRTDKVTLGFTAPTAVFDGQYTGYQLRCDVKPLDFDALDVAGRDAWWTNARQVALPSNFKPPAPGATSLDQTVSVDLRIGEANYCAIRAVDALNRTTPLVASTTAVTVPFRSQRFAAPNPSRLAGADVAGVGDINGDGIDDLLVGGLGAAYLVFGSTTGWASATPNVTFLSEVSDDAGASWTGWQVAGLGDFNRDTRPDFAIAAPYWNGGAGAGRVFVFYGRASGDAWPTTNIDMTGACAADLCLENSSVGDLFGNALDSAGDFNGDGVPDIAIGAPSSVGSSTRDGRLFVVLGKAYQDIVGGTRPGNFWQQALPVNSTSLEGFVLTGGGAVRSLGTSTVGIGNFDGVAGDDLIVSALGGTGNTGKVFFLSGHTYTLGTTAGLSALPLTELGFRTAGVPNGNFIAEGTAGLFGGAVYALGNIYDVPGANKPGVLDIAIKEAQSNDFLVYPGDNNFATADAITVLPASANGRAIILGITVGNGRVRGDLDGDGIPELIASDALSEASTAGPGVGHVWYGSTLAAKIAGGHQLTTRDSSPLDPPPADGYTGQRLVEFVGDLNGDSKPDIVVAGPGDVDNYTGDGGFSILY